MATIPELTTPPTAFALDRYKELIDTITTWTPDKKFGQVETFTTTIDGLFWAARRSLHQQPIAAFKKVLFENHTEHEAKYMHIITRYAQLDSAEPWKSYRVEYKLPFPLRKREFVFYIQCVELSETEFIVVSLPRFYDSDMVRGKYISVEKVRQTDEGVEWTMATTSDAGGLLPMFLQRPQLTATIAKDVDAVLEYMNSV